MVDHDEAVVTEDELDEILYRNIQVEDFTRNKFVEVVDEIVEQRRWVTVNYRVVKRFDGKFFGYYYESPSTEMQEGSETEVTVDDVKEVFPHKVVTIVYKDVPQED